MSLLSLRFEIAKALRTALSHVDVQEHGGAFSEEDVKRYSTRSPAVVVACLGISGLEVQGSVVSTAAICGAFCLSDNSNKANRDAAVLLLAESVLVEVPQNNWGGAANKVADNIKARNQYTTKLAKLGVAMWSVTWSNQVDLQRNAITTLDDFLTMVSTYDLGQTDDTVDTTDKLVLPT